MSGSRDAMTHLLKAGHRKGEVRYDGSRDAMTHKLEAGYGHGEVSVGILIKKYNDAQAESGTRGWQGQPWDGWIKRLDDALPENSTQRW